MIDEDKITSTVPLMLVNSHITGYRLVSLPFSDICEPLLGSNDESEILIHRIISYCNTNKLKSLEFRCSEKNYFSSVEGSKVDLRHFILFKDCNSDLLNSFSDNTKRNIKKALKEGVNVEPRNTEEGIKLFYKMQCETRKKHGLPPQPFIFYKNLYKYVISKEKGEILFALDKGLPVSGSIFLTVGKKALFKFGASYANNTLAGASHLIMYKAIKRFFDLGFEEFDFGRTEKEHDGLRRYKLGFNSEEQNIYTTKFDLKKKKVVANSINTNGFHNKVFSRSPIFLLRIIGKSIYRHIG